MKSIKIIKNKEAKQKAGSALVITLLIMVTLTGMFVFSPLKIETAQAAGWYAGWDYSKEITITNANNSYQMFINVSYAVDSGDVNCSSHCNANFSDLRFLDIDNTTVLDYWFENVSAGDYAWTWVELPTDVETDNAIYMYYGNAGATDVYNGSATFPIYFDNFTTNNSADWTLTSPNSFSFSSSISSLAGRNFAILL